MSDYKIGEHNIGTGILPGHKRPSLYTMINNECHILASFRNDGSRQLFEFKLEEILKGSGAKIRVEGRDDE